MRDGHLVVPGEDRGNAIVLEVAECNSLGIGLDERLAGLFFGSFPERGFPLLPPNEGEGIISCVASRASSRSVKGSTLLLCDSARRIACSIVYGGLGSTLVAPVENLHPDLFSQRETPPSRRKKSVRSLGSQSIVLHVDIEYDGELVVDIIPLYGFKPHFLGGIILPLRSLSTYSCLLRIVQIT